MNALFQIGQKVVCVDSKYSDSCYFQSPLVEGKSYTILGMTKCKCGGIEVDVGTENPARSKQLICTCGHITANNNWTHDQFRFVPLDFDRQADEVIHQALKGIRVLDEKL